MKVLKYAKKMIGFLITVCMVLTLNLVISSTEVSAQTNDVLTYVFKDSESGFAEGTITLKSEEGGTYYIYWADNEKALDGYYEITKSKIEKGQSYEFSFESNVAIPSGASKIIAFKSDDEPTDKSIKNAAAIFDIPAEKKMIKSSESPLYTFNSYSDIHIDEEHFGQTPANYWQYSEKHLEDALKYAKEKNSDFIISSGDQVTNASWDNIDKEYKAYQNILSKSDYTNHIYECSGNHEVRQDTHVQEGLDAFIKGTGLDSKIDTLSMNKPYFTVEEPTTNDLFIFMALEKGYRPAKYDEFTDEQLNFLETTLADNYGKGKNIFLIQHALISGYGAGDDVNTPYYGGSINKDLESAKKFEKIIEKYPNIVWISGHTHEDFRMGYNFSNNNGTSCYMIHNSSVSNPTHLKEQDGKKSLDYGFIENSSQGYYVEVYKNAMIFYGANLVDEKIYPSYSYIIKNNTSVQNGVKEDKYELVDSDITAGNVDSILENVKTYLDINYEYASYDKYQDLKKVYYENKDLNTKELTSSKLKNIYSNLKSKLSDLSTIINYVDKK
ncbi:metallophosphoesterase [Clostridium sp. BJN0001]|uniref:metallophosphoesterase family protein n=1 Tax=Clostridium sp. BJN0001 TaxID=2930219 RepID=UPI001FD3084E|nr:metallophosphoesterase [Clostridium sp. BJN0001]